jgi:hypothetical protein
MVDYPETRTPPQVTEALKQQNLLGQMIGISRIVAQQTLPTAIWCGILPQAYDAHEAQLDDGTTIKVSKYQISWHELIERLTFGAFGKVLDVYLPAPSSELWNPHIVRDLGFTTGDRRYKRFFHYLELYPHVDASAWDTRSIWVRVLADIRRDFAAAFGGRGGTIGFGAIGQRGGGSMAIRSSQEVQIGLFYDRLSELNTVIGQFETLLAERGDAPESVFHEFLKEHPILLDVYGEADSKPRFHYPAGESPLAKTYVEPDFIIRYPGDTYKIVELERPGKAMATQQGQPRAEVGQAAFQIAEFTTFIRNHYDLLKERYPYISTQHTTMLVISRATEASIGRGRDKQQYMELVKSMYATSEVYLYDDLVHRVKQALKQLASLIPYGGR